MEVADVLDILPLPPVIERLQGACPVLRLVGSAADMAAATGAQTPADPAAFVILLAADGIDAKEGSGPLRQAFNVTVGVVVRVNTAGARGEAGLKKISEPVGQVRRVLFGWQHPDAELKFSIGAEGVEDFDPDKGRLLYRIDFVTRTRIQENVP